MFGANDVESPGKELTEAGFKICEARIDRLRGYPTVTTTIYLSELVGAFEEYAKAIKHICKKYRLSPLWDNGLKDLPATVDNYVDDLKRNELEKMCRAYGSGAWTWR